MPALGCAAIFRVTTRAIRSMLSSITWGPTPQLIPTMSAPSFSRCGPKVSGGVPSRLLPSSSRVSCAMTGRSHNSLAARMAASISLRSVKVSRQSRSTPPKRSRLLWRPLTSAVRIGTFARRVGITRSSNPALIVP